MSEDYYDILGIEKDADPDSIRKAYRREAKKSHPDSSGCAASSERFRRVEEAYETLGDTHRREAYDQRESKRGSSSIPIHTAPVEPRAFGPRGAYHGGPAQQRPFGPVSGMRPPFLFGSTVSSEPLSEPLLEILLSPEEAGRGVAVPVEVPVTLPCPDCTEGRFWQRMFCFTCGGTGMVRRVKRMVLEVPPGIRSGREFLIDTGTYPAGSIRVRVLVG